MTPQEVIKTFMAKLTNHGYSSSSSVATYMLNDAVKASSDFLSIQNVIDSMKSDQIAAERQAVEQVLGSDFAGKTLADLSSSIRGATAKTYDINHIGNAYLNPSNDQRTTVERLIKERKAYIFLEKFCGIQLENNYWLTSTNVTTAWTGESSGNFDTGAISGSDANITLSAGDVIYGTTLTSDLMTALAAQDGVSLSGDNLIIGTGIEKTRSSVVPEIGNMYTASSAQAQSISTGANDWIVVTGDTADSIVTGGADSIVAGGGNDLITVGADYASILTGSGSDSVEISADVNIVTLGDLDSNDTLTISGTFQVGSAHIEDSLLVVTDKTGSRQIRLADIDNAKNARLNGKSIATWLSNAGININSLSTTSSANLIEEPTTVEEDGGGRIAIDDEYQPTLIRSSNAAQGTQNIATKNSNGTFNVNLDDVTLTDGTITAGNSTVGAISSEFPNVSSFTKNGLTINLLGVTSDKNGGTSAIQSKTLDELTDDQKTIVAGLFKWWAKECLKLNEESYGIGFKSPSAMVNQIGLFFYDSGSSGNTLATVWNSSVSGKTIDLKLNVNMKYYNGIAADNVNGESSSTSAFLDRTLAHELTHAVMGANIEYFGSLPQFIKEGTAELTHGIDDERGSRIFELAYDASRLNTALNLSNTGTGTADAYAGGYMFLRYFARQASLQSIAGYENPDAGGTWTISGTTATYKVDGSVVATIKGLASGLAGIGTMIDGIRVSGDTITLSKKVLGSSNVTLTSNKYTLALGDDLHVVTFTDKAWTVNKGTATLKGNLTAGYSLLETGKTITYSAAKNNQTLATVKGLATTGFSASDFSTTDSVITLKKSMLGTSNVTVTGDGYTLALDAPEPELQTPYWTLNKTTATYKQDTSAGFTLAADAKSATYSKLATTTLATVNGIKKVTAANKDAIESAITISDKVITLGADALGTTNVTVTGDGYTLAMDSPRDTPVERWTISKTTATYDSFSPAHFTPATNNQTYTYTKETKLANLATVKGLNSGAIVNGSGNVSDKDAKTILSLADNVLTLTGDESFGNKVEVTTGYTLNNQLTAPAITKTYWAVANGTAALKQDKTAGYTTSTKNGATIFTYDTAKTGKTALTLATVSGLDKTLTDTADVFSGLTYDLDGKTITVKNSVLTKANLTLKGDFKLELDDAVPTATKDATIWEVNGTNAVYKDVKIGYFTRKNDKAFNYNKEKVLVTHATISGLRNNAALDSFSLSDNVITLTADALVENPTAKTKIALNTNEDYTLKLADGVLNVEYNEAGWTYSNGKAVLKTSVKSAGYLPSDDGKSITYNTLGTSKTLATVTGVKSANGITVEDSVITLTAAALNNKNVTLGKTDPYTLALGDDSLAPQPGEETWSKSGGTANLTVTYSTGYTPSADERTLVYSGKSTVKTLATINGINPKVDIETFRTVADGESKKIPLTAYQLTNSVTISGEYKYEFDDAVGYAEIVSSSADDTISVTGIGISVTGGRGNDTITLGGTKNTIIYGTGDGSDVIADFTRYDKLKITNGTPKVVSEGSDAIITVGAGTIKLLCAAGQTITILDAKNNAKTYATTAPTAGLLYEENYVAPPQLSELVKPDTASYTTYEIPAALSLTREDNLTPELSYAK